MTPRAAGSCRYVALLRAINVGGHTVTMDHLKKHFERLGFAGVETFIASGNVIFRSGPEDPVAMEKRIETALHKALGYETATFLRTTEELAAAAAHQAFPRAAIASAAALNVAFLKDPLDTAARRKVAALVTGIDDFHVHGREVYWLCRTRQGKSTFSNAVLEKTLGLPSTIRGINTVRRMAERYA